MPQPKKDSLMDELKSFTDARVFLGTHGASLPTKAILDFQYAHAAAKDAVYSELSINGLVSQLEKTLGITCLSLHSCASDRATYLKNPSLGRQLNEESFAKLEKLPTKDYKLSIVIADGLSAPAIHENILPFLQAFLPHVQAVTWNISTICIVKQGRVAIADQIGALFKSEMTMICIGERPGLSSPNSMGIYFTYQPQVGLTDEARNCISNIRVGGLSYKIAAAKLFYLLDKGFKLGKTGTGLMDDFGGYLNS